MNIGLIGSGGREHVYAKISEVKLVKKNNMFSGKCWYLSDSY